MENCGPQAARGPRLLFFFSFYFFAAQLKSGIRHNVQTKISEF
jgi:hypothetical protein